MKLKVKHMVIPAALAVIFSCATVPPVPGSGDGILQPDKLVIASPVKAGVPYQALFTCIMKSQSIDIINGSFFWNSEGPFEYPLSGHELVKVNNQNVLRLVFMLYTGRPAAYNISGYITFKDNSTGKVYMTSVRSAGNIVVK